MALKLKMVFKKLAVKLQKRIFYIKLNCEIFNENAKL